jgi:hypothetical protein
VVSLGTRLSGGRQIEDPHEVPLPETSHKRVITVLDGFPQSRSSSASVELQVRRPAVEFATYERWINWDLTDPKIKDALDFAHQKLVLSSPTATADLTIDDPSVERIVVELIELFPEIKHYGFSFLKKDWSEKEALIGGINAPVTDDQKLTVSVGAVTSISGTGEKITLVRGGVYEVRLYGAVPEGQQTFAAALPNTGARFGKGVWQGLQRRTDDKSYRLGAPLVRTFEVVTDEMPTQLCDPGCDPLYIQREIPPTVPADRARVGFSSEFVSDKENYRLLRYVSRVALLSQRWGWRGRPLLVVRPGDLNGIDDRAVRLPGNLNDPAKHWPRAKEFEDAAFIERRVDDIGVIEETRLHLAHVLPPLASEADKRPPIFLKDLRYLGGANWWRFGLRATSRYAAMRPNLGSLTVSTEIAPKSREKFTPHWHTLVVRDRDNGRKPKRPSLLMVLPLTESVMDDTAVPPLLAIFSEPMFANFHIGDGIEAAVDYARHPLSALPLRWRVGVEQTALDQLAEIAKAYKELVDPVGAPALNLGKLRSAVLNLENLRASQQNVWREKVEALSQRQPPPPAELAQANGALKDAQDAKAFLDQVLQITTISSSPSTRELCQTFSLLRSSVFGLR